ncbi:hypothetical protein PISMIDRAFT_17663 [Pisolithus microcarpus 441]|uniref:ATP-dependent DNA helicase n=1 Tax=Pisolithus microcarpus 441 TaxID=765257 RepID=A0A0C9YJC2_9AGAM|nr:hypothetical protein PISMIDRAFT_17663 [Pisolithus microcarpus 441]
MLNVDQHCAYDIVTWHLNHTLTGRSPPPLQMLLVGEGGTGKSKVIQTITQHFQARGARHLLLKAAYTRVAASLIDRKTTHTIGMITWGDNKGVSARTKARLQHFWREYKYLIIDEMSMIGKTFLAKLSCNIAIGKMIEGTANTAHSFRGLNVILCGDFHQFPPVAVGPSKPLYMPGKPQNDNPQAQLGRTIYEEFQTVVVLTEQIRVTDKVWQDFLRHLHMGRVQESHIGMLRQLVLTNRSVPPPNFAETPWADACLWNDAALRKHAQVSGGKVFVCTADDTIKGELLTLQQRYAFALRVGGGEQRGHRVKRELPDVVELSVGMRVMVTQNVETDLDITNGACGVILDIFLHPQEPPLPADASEHHLQFIPTYILVKLTRTRTSHLPGLEASVIPVEPVMKTYSIRYIDPQGTPVTGRVQQVQYPITPAYAFTDYRSQGQTLSHIIVDIARPPTGGLMLFNLYVALSRSSGRETIRLLRDFDEKLFLASHSTDLIAEDDRLAALQDKTTTWWGQLPSDK